MKLFQVLMIFIISSSVMATEFFPSTIYQLDPRFSHHVLVVEKSTHSLYLYEHKADSVPQLVKKFQIATGKIRGNKKLQGDHKTPEGIYHFQRFHSSEFLLSKYGKYGEIYGAGAFTLNYPNEIDKRKGKTGGGIWLHSTDDDKRVSKGLDSRGCVVAIDADLKEISKYIELTNTPTVIVQDLHFLSKDTWEKNKSEITSTLNTWMESWQNKKFDAYINSYSKEEFKNRKGNWKQYRTYKKAVFARKDKPQIEFKHVSILSNNDYAVVTLEQDYKSKVINDIGKKTLYLKKDSNYKWKIVSENWNKIEQKEDIGFTPAMRFFNNNVTKSNSKDIANDSGSI